MHATWGNIIAQNNILCAWLMKNFLKLAEIDIIN